MPALTSIALGTAALGGIAGAIPKTANAESEQKIKSGNATALENQGQAGLSNSFNWLTNAANAGPGQSDVSNAYSADKNFASMLGDYSKGGYNPNAQDIASANGVASQLFAPQQVGLNQSFIDQTVAADRQAGIMGRSVSDPILQAKLRTNLMNQQAQLNAQQGAFAQNYALQQPMMRLGFADQQRSILGGLATQAMNNRQQLAAMGQNIMANQQNWRLANATKTSSISQSSGGGIGGAITGALGGLGTGLGIGDKLSNALGSAGGVTSSSSPSFNFGNYGQTVGGSNIFGVSNFGAKF